jgi:Na+/H+ antiporter NhaD/arsenite permease-like protein
MTDVRLAIFAVTYLLIAVQQFPGVRIGRPAASLLGAAAMIAVGGLPLHAAFEAIDVDVLVFLLGVLLLTAYLEMGGFFAWAAAHIVARTRSPHALLGAVVAASGLLSALFINDTVCLVFTPLVIAALRAMRLRPLPFLLAIAFAANVGSAMTPTGNPQNMLIAVSSGIPYARFVTALALPALGGLVLVYVVIAVAFRRDLRAVPAPAAAAPAPMRDRVIVTEALALFGLALAGWLRGYPLPVVAIGAGAIMVALGGRDVAAALARVEWSLLLFFAALFVVMRGVQHHPLVLDLTSRAAASLHGRPWHDAVVVSGAMTALSNVVSNVPAVILWRPVVPGLPNAELMWLVMAMSSTFAGNLTLVGSMANLIVAERAAARGERVGFGDVLRVGVPLTLLTLAWGIAAVVLVVR